MQYLYITLIGYTRMSLAGYKGITITFDNLLQILLGTNGSGKSSLLRQISPLPGDKNFFEKDGSKEVGIKKGDTTYILKSTFQPSTKHSLCIKHENGELEELNKGGTITIQLQLIKEIFNIDHKIFSIINGDNSELFTNMAPTKRKDIFLQLCNSSYDYAMSVYNTIMSSKRDYTGSINTLQKRIATETEKLIPDEESQNLIRTINLYQDILTHMLECKRATTDDLDILEEDLKGLNTLKNNLINELLKLEKHEFGFNIGYLETVKHNLNHTKISTITELNTLSSRHNEISEKIQSLGNTTTEEYQLLKTELNNVNSIYDTAIKNVLVKLDSNSINLTSDAFNNVCEDISTISANLPINSDRRFSSVLLNEKTHALTIETNARNAASEALVRTKTNKEHMIRHKDNPEVSCPKCRHSFNPDFNEIELSKLITDEGILIANIKTHNETITKLQEYVTECREYENNIRHLYSLIRSNELLLPYFNTMITTDIIFNNPGSIPGIIEIVKSDIYRQVNLLPIINSKKRLEDKLNTIDSSNLELIGHYRKELESLTDKISKVTSKLSKVELMAINVNSKIVSRNRIDAIYDKLKTMVGQLDSLKSRADLTNVINTENKIIKEIQLELNTLSYKLNANKHFQDNIDLMKSQVLDSEAEVKALTIIADKLSPTTGLIAEGLFGFIRAFIGEMNEILGDIWTYPISIGYCNKSEEDDLDLDYKFPIYKNGEFAANDVSLGSTAMLELFNLAFRLVAMKYYGLKDTLYIDEFGSSFDHAHRGKATDVIHRLIESESFKQVFMISHYESMYGVLSNVSFCVLEDSNIIKPSKNVNENVIFY